MHSQFDKITLTEYLLGQLPSQYAAQVAAAAKTNPDLAAELESLAEFVGPTDTPTEQEPIPINGALRPTFYRRTLIRAAGVGLGGLALGGGGFAAGYKVALPPPPPPPPPPPTVPLFKDNFDSDVFDITKWDANRVRKEVRVFDGRAHLANRGSLVTVQEFREPIELSFDWLWVDVEGDPKYSDELRVVLHTAGRHHNQRPFEIPDGIGIRFSTRNHHVVTEVGDGTNPAKHHTRRQSPILSTPFKAVKWHHIRITDDGKKIAVFVPKKRAVGEDYEEVLALEAEYSEKFVEHHIAIYNRERVGFADHLSRIDNLKVCFGAGSASYCHPASCH